jgi:hypothetical protein
MDLLNLGTYIILSGGNIPTKLLLSTRNFLPTVPQGTKIVEAKHRISEYLSYHNF